MNGVLKWKVVAYALLIFLAGLFIGAVGSPFLVRTFLRPPSPNELSRHLLARLQSQLALSSAQTAQIKPLIEQTSADLDRIRVATAKQISDRITQTNSKIAPFLTPEQRAKLEKIDAERRKHLSREIPFLAPPPPH